MATYREIVGKKIKKVSSDPSAGTAGQMWYNSTTGTLRGPAILEATSSGANLGTPRAQLAGGGIQTAAFVAGGTQTSPSSGTTTTENYNGTGWASSAAMSNARVYFGATGPQTAGLAVAGGPPFSPSPGGAQNNVEEYDGEGWTGGGAIPTNVWTNKCFGTQTAAVSAGSEPNTTNYVFNYNGSSWTTGGTMNNIRSYSGTGGTQTAGIVFAGANPSAPVGKATEFYDGSSWTSGPLCSVISYSMFSGGTQTSALKAGGQFIPAPSAPYVTNVIEKYDGSAWSTSPATLATARGYSAGQTQNAPDNSAGLFAGGTTTNVGTGHTGATEEFNISTTAFTAAAWASGNNLNTVRTLGGSAIPTVSDGIVFGGSGYTDVTEKYNGTSWTTLPATLNTARGYIAGFGTSTAAVAAGGYTAPNNPQSLVEEFNGSSWSEETNLPAARKSSGNCGTLTAGLIMGGSTAQPYAANVVNSAFEYDGTSWTATPGSMPEAKGQGMSGGTQTAAYYAAGRIPPNTYTQKTAEYNGSSFSEGGDVVTISETTAQGAQGATGTQTAGLATGGQPAKTNTYDGTAWATSANFNTGRNKGMGGGTATAALIAGGGAAPGNTAATEEFTAETTAVNVKTFTTS